MEQSITLPPAFLWGKKLVSINLQEPLSLPGTQDFITSRQRILGGVWGRRGEPDRSHSIWCKIMVLKDHTVQSAQGQVLLLLSRTHKTFQHFVAVFFFFCLCCRFLNLRELSINVTDGWCTAVLTFASEHISIPSSRSIRSHVVTSKKYFCEDPLQ